MTQKFIAGFAVVLAALVGFAATMDEATVASLRAAPSVAYIEQDVTMRSAADQANPTWGLDRIDQPALPLDSNYHYDETGAGVTAYIVDGGSRTGSDRRTGSTRADGGRHHARSR